MTSRRIAQVSAIAAFAAMWAVSVWCFGTLPERFPSHFDINGVPDGFAEKSVLAWFALPLIFTVLTAFFVGLAAGLPAFSRKYSAYINVPNKAAFVALPEASRMRALEPMRDLMFVMIVPLALDATYIVYGSWHVASGAGRTLSAWPVVGVLGFTVIALVVATTRTKRAIAAETAAPAA